jgi:Ca2+-binding EF-hand superfamily protein
MDAAIHPRRLVFCLALRQPVAFMNGNEMAYSSVIHLQRRNPAARLEENVMRKFIVASMVASIALMPAIALAAQDAPAPAAAPVSQKMDKKDRGHTELRADVADRVARLFARFDADNDGVVTQAELQSVQSKRGGKMGKGAAAGDMNHGNMDHAGMNPDKMGKAGHMRDPSKMFDRLDANKDGKITRDEMDAHRATMMKDHPNMPAGDGSRMNKMFDRFDANKDGAITFAEMQAAPMKARRGGDHPGMNPPASGVTAAAPGAPQPGTKAWGRSAGLHLFGQVFAMSDLNKDGKITLAEAQQAALTQFDKADSNHDGTVTSEEHRAAIRAWRQ